MTSSAASWSPQRAQRSCAKLETRLETDTAVHNAGNYPVFVNRNGWVFQAIGNPEVMVDLSLQMINTKDDLGGPQVVGNASMFPNNTSWNAA